MVYEHDGTPKEGPDDVGRARRWLVVVRRDTARHSLVLECRGMGGPHPCARQRIRWVSEAIGGCTAHPRRPLRTWRDRHRRVPPPLRRTAGHVVSNPLRPPLTAPTDRGHGVRQLRFLSLSPFHSRVEPRLRRTEQVVEDESVGSRPQCISPLQPPPPLPLTTNRPSCRHDQESEAIFTAPDLTRLDETATGASFGSGDRRARSSGNTPPRRGSGPIMAFSVSTLRLRSRDTKARDFVETIGAWRQ